LEKYLIGNQVHLFFPKTYTLPVVLYFRSLLNLEIVRKIMTMKKKSENGSYVTRKKKVWQEF
jgi:hypothetical protein